MADLAQLAEERRARDEQRRREQQQKNEEEKKDNQSQRSNNDEESRPLLTRLFTSSNAQQKQIVKEILAKDETLMQTLHINLCPKLTFCTFTVFIVIVDIIMFIISLSIYKMANTAFLAPSNKALDLLGWQDAAQIQEGEIWRFITPTFLHANLIHITMNVLATLVIGSGLENGLGIWKIVVLYFISSFGGILFGCVFNPTVNSVGASTAIFGLIGYYVAYLCINWTVLGEKNPTQRFSLMMFIFFSVIINFEISATQQNIDTIGHIGGLITGIIMGYVISENDNRQDRKQGFCDFIQKANYKNKCGIIFLFSYFLVFLLIFFLLIKT